MAPATADPGDNPARTFTYSAVGDRAQWAYPGGADQHIFDAAGTSLGVYGGWDVVWMGGRVLAVYEGSETNFFHINHLNSASVLTNHAGTAVEDILFYPWGQDTWHLWGSGGYNFAGMPYYDTHTNTNPTMFRFYSQNIGRWHSPDPVGGDITNPQSLNRYAYVMNNPTSFTDPSGLGVCPPGTVWTSCNPEAAAQSNLGGLLGGLYNGWGVANMNEFVALEAAAMTAFLTQTSIHTMYQYQTISSDIGYFQPLDVANAPWEAMGAYSTATSVTGIQFAANNGLRAPDFVSINVNVGIPYLLNLVGPTFAINIGKNGHVYIGPGINVGKAWTLVSGSATANWMTQPNQMQSFLTKNSFSINGGYWGGVQGAWTPGSGVAGGVGFVSPQVGGAWTYSFDLGHWFGGW